MNFQFIIVHETAIHQMAVKFKLLQVPLEHSIINQSPYHKEKCKRPRDTKCETIHKTRQSTKCIAKLYPENCCIGHIGLEKNMSWEMLTPYGRPVERLLPINENLTIEYLKSLRLSHSLLWSLSQLFNLRWRSMYEGRGTTSSQWNANLCVSFGKVWFVSTDKDAFESSLSFLIQKVTMNKIF